MSSDEPQFPFDPEATKLIHAAWDGLEHAHRMHVEADRAFETTSTPSDRRTDEENSTGRRVYLGAGALLASAHDHHRGLHTMVKGGPLGPSAPWTLVRGIFETSLWAIWILEPNNQGERFQRALRREVADHVEGKNWFETLRGMPTSVVEERMKQRQEVEDTYEAEAARVGYPWKKMLKDKPALGRELRSMRIPNELMKESPDLLAAGWKSLSGVAHGFTWATQATTVKHSGTKLPGGSRELRSLDENLFGHTLVMTASLAAAAANLYHRRSTSISSPI